MCISNFTLAGYSTGSSTVLGLIIRIPWEYWVAKENLCRQQQYEEYEYEVATLVPRRMLARD